MRKGVGAGICSRTVDNFVGIIETKGNGIAVLQFTALYFLSVNEQSAALTAIFDIVLVRLGDDCRAVPGNTPIGELQVIAGFRATPDQEGHLRHADITPRAVWRDHLEHGLR